MPRNRWFRYEVTPVLVTSDQGMKPTESHVALSVIPLTSTTTAGFRKTKRFINKAVVRPKSGAPTQARTSNLNGMAGCASIQRSHTTMESDPSSNFNSLRRLGYKMIGDTFIAAVVPNDAVEKPHSARPKCPWPNYFRSGPRSVAKCPISGFPSFTSLFCVDIAPNQAESAVFPLFSAHPAYP